MQSLGTFVNESLKHSAQKKFGKKEFVSQFGELKQLSAGDCLLCPICMYESKKNRKGSAKIFKNGGETSFKCFACGVWRLIK